MNATKRDHTELFFSLIGAWVIYALCQQDIVLPLVALLPVAVSYVRSMTIRRSEPKSIHLSWRLTVGIALIAGGAWRMMWEPPATAVSFLPVLHPALQSASVIIGVLLWFRRKFRWRHNAVKFTAWFTVATSINISFDLILHAVFWGYCLMSVIFLFCNVFFPPAVEGRPKQSWKNQGPLFYIYSFTLFVLTGVLLVVLVRGVRMGDDAITHFIRDYIGIRSFTFFQPSMRIGGSGRSSEDVKPILEVQNIKEERLYLAGQIFEEYDKGIWYVPDDVQRVPVFDDIPEGMASRHLVMFEFLQDIIPMPRGITAMKSKQGKFLIDRNGIIVNTEKTIPAVAFLMEEGSQPASREDLDPGRWRQIPLELMRHMNPRAQAMVGSVREPRKVAFLIASYFQTRYQYSLDVNFFADDLGLLYLIDQRPPAYCSYFASAMVLMLRSVGVPARMVTGFLATEKTGNGNHALMVRGRDAHAWVEVLLPVEDNQTDLLVENNGRAMEWVRFDPTPEDSRQALLASRNRVNPWADFLWCSQKRLKVAILDMETETLVWIIFILVAIAAIEEGIRKLIIRMRRRESDQLEYVRFKHRLKGNPHAEVYRRYHDLLKKYLSKTPADYETEGDFFRRLGRDQDVPDTLVQKLEDFVALYQRVRFGRKNQTEGMDQFNLSAIEESLRVMKDKTNSQL